MAFLKFKTDKAWYERDNLVNVKAGDVREVTDKYVHDALIEKGHAVPYTSCVKECKTSCDDAPKEPQAKKPKAKKGRPPKREKKVIDVAENKGAE